MSIEMLVDATLSAIASAATNNVWLAARDRLARVFRPSNPSEESAQLDVLFDKLLHTNPADSGRHKELVEAYVQDRLRQHPEREWAWMIPVAIEEVRQIIFEIESPKIHLDAPQATVNIPDRPPSHKAPAHAAPATRHEGAPAWIPESPPSSVATARLWDMPTELAAKRLALMPSAEKLLSNMDCRLAANLLAAMAPPRPAEILVRIAPDRGAPILKEMDTGTAAQRITEIADRDLDIAAHLLYLMKESAAKLLGVMGQPYPAELLGRMAPDPAAQILSTMPFERVAARLAEMKPEFAASVLAKMDKASATGLLAHYAPRHAAELLALMAPPEGADLLARMDVGWAYDRLTEMSADQALQLLVALRPPRTLISVIDRQLAVTLLSEAVQTLARSAEDQTLLKSAYAEAARIRMEAQTQAQQILEEAKDVLEETATREPTPTPASDLAERILDRLNQRKYQTMTKLADSLGASEEMINVELERLMADDKVTVSWHRGGVARYSATAEEAN
jgi:flagellar motility protein MotE (MotC chaperone)